MAGRSITLARDDFLHLARKHVRKAAEWGHTAGTDFWFVVNPGLDIFGAASTATGDELAENGWTATSLVNTQGGTADFGSSTDVGTPNHVLTNAASDLLQSPQIFGDWSHMEIARRLAGRAVLPRYLVTDFFAAMTVHSANESTSGWGLIEYQGSPNSAAAQLAYISTDGTNFQVSSNGGTPLDLTTDDANWHLFRIVLDRDSMKVSVAIDGTYYLTKDSSTTLAVSNDEFPVSFGMHASTTNRPALAWAHIYYDWRFPR